MQTCMYMWPMFMFVAFVLPLHSYNLTDNGVGVMESTTVPVPCDPLCVCVQVFTIVVMIVQSDYQAFKMKS